MAELVRTAELTPESVARRAGRDLDEIYNGLDCCVTFEVLEELQKLTNQVPEIYNFERALQAPALEMMLRGFRVDQYERGKAIAELKLQIKLLVSRLGRMVEIFGVKLEFNPGKIVPTLLNSRLQLLDLFYKRLHLPETHKYAKGKKSLSMDRETLEKLQQHYIAMPIISALLSIREMERSVKVLETEIDNDGRMRTSYNIAATETGRWSSSKNAEGTGGNLQNWNWRLRKVMVADVGYKLYAIDLEQADAREIGFAIGVLFGDWTYLDACERGDLHTSTSRLVWPERPWTGDNKKDRKLAEEIFYRDFSFRDMAKRGGHGTTYLGTPFTMGRHLKVPTKVMENFQARFFAAYPGIPRLHLWTAKELQTTFKIRTYFGRERHFFGRPNDDATLREAVAHLGQSPTADRMSLGVYNIWSRMRHEVRLTAQLHDAVYFQAKDEGPEYEAYIAKKALACCEIPVTSPCGRVFSVPGECKIGWNWMQKHNEDKPLDPRKNPYNPNGLIKWSATKPDLRTRLAGEVF